MKILVFLLALVMALNVNSQVKVIAHRGASFKAPENTVASAKLGWELGADAVEVDVYLSSDNRVMVIHDETTKRTSMGKTNYKVAETSSEVLNKIDVGSYKSEVYAGETIPFLEDILAAIPKGKGLVIEIKCGSEVIPALKKAIDESGKLAQCTFISFGWETICDVQNTFPENDCYYLKMTPLGLSKKIKQSAEAGLKGINLYHKIINEKVVSKAHQFGLEVLAWTIDESEDFERMKRLGVVAVTTNKPEIFVK